jgi:KDO2-lipid IV(A) lauroyltransferase
LPLPALSLHPPQEKKAVHPKTKATFSQRLLFVAVLTFSFLCRFIPYRLLHQGGKFIGTIGYWLASSHRRRTLNNLAIAAALPLCDKQRRKIAKEAFQNLAICSVDYFYLAARPQKIADLIECENPQLLESVLSQGRGAVLLGAHQANWELSFLDLTRRFRGVAIGRPIKNSLLYRWILSIRQYWGGEVIAPKDALRLGERVLKKGQFLAFVGDQALPESSYAYPLFGVRAWTSPAPAFLCYKARCPLLVVTVERRGWRYFYRFSEPLTCDWEKPFKAQVESLMDKALGLLEHSIANCPGQWLWQHNRWKQVADSPLPKKYRHDFICIIAAPDAAASLPFIENIFAAYPRAFITLYWPQQVALPLQWQQVAKPYTKAQDLYQICDPKVQLVFNFYPLRNLRRHFIKQGALVYKELTPSSPFIFD